MACLAGVAGTLSLTTAKSGPLVGVLHQLIGGLRQAMGYCGAETIEAMKQARLLVNNPCPIDEADAARLYEAAW